MAKFREQIIASRKKGGGEDALMPGIKSTVAAAIELNQEADVPQDSHYIYGKLARSIILVNRIRGGGLPKLNTRNRVGQASDAIPATDAAGRSIDKSFREYNIKQTNFDIPTENYGPLTNKHDADNFTLIIGGGKIRNPAAVSSAAEGITINRDGNFSKAVKLTGIEQIAKERVTLYFAGDGVMAKYDTLHLQFVPQEVQFTPENRLIAIASPGRNTPFYHYTGAEDTLEFTIDWVSEEDGKEDVIAKCRWLEAMSKNDGYLNKPAYVMIGWGREGKLFRDIAWVIEKAPYKLQNFNRGYKDPTTQSFVGTSLLPIQAYQQLTLKRVDSQNTLRDSFMYSQYTHQQRRGVRLIPTKESTLILP